MTNVYEDTQHLILLGKYKFKQGDMSTHPECLFIATLFIIAKTLNKLRCL